MCNCGKRRQERLAARKSVTASAAANQPREPQQFAPKRWSSRLKAREQ